MKKTIFFLGSLLLYGTLSSQELKVVAGYVADSAPQSKVASSTMAPNSYIFDPHQSVNDGLYIPVAKAYDMWASGSYMGSSSIPSGTITADVLWEDVNGLIKSGANFGLEIIGSGSSAKIKIPINKSKEGNAVIAFKVNGEVYWSWHIWVTDDPTKGSTYKSFPNVKRQLTSGMEEVIPDADWQWMDRNLGALSKTNTTDDWNRNIGLQYQWGRKDPIPPLVYRGSDFYEVSGSIGRVRHRTSVNQTGSVKIDDLIKTIQLSSANITSNIRLSVQNPLSLIYVNKDGGTTQALYNNNANLPYNWFGTVPNLVAGRLSEVNLWSDNSRGTSSNSGYNSDASAKSYKNKSAYDPCPNGWRIPSMLVANLANTSYVDDIRLDFSPFGPRSNMSKNNFIAGGYDIIKPNDINAPSFLSNRKLYPNIGYDLSNIGGFDFGMFPGTGGIARAVHGGQYTDMHHMVLWTATMARHFDGTPVVGSRLFFMIGDKGQVGTPDSAYPNITGLYSYDPMGGGNTSDTAGCRCIKDPLYVVNDYDFQTEYFSENTYITGLTNPNSYQVVKSNVLSTIEIPVSKAFSVQSQLLNNPSILESQNYKDLKVNVLWTDNTSLINTVSIINPSPGSLSAIDNSKIKVNVNPGQSGNAVVTLHNGSITNPVYWSWHIWVTETEVGSNKYLTEMRDVNAVNYINYVKKGEILKTEFMDRNLGASNIFPSSFVNSAAPNASELALIKKSGGLQYQWGRKDPIPAFMNADRTSYPIFLGSVSDVTGVITYTTLNASTYNTLGGDFIKEYNTYTNASNANVLSTDKIADKVAKVLGYSVGNPLVYMTPSMLAPNNAGYTLGTDWVANEAGLAADRWGRGGNKSPFDPCPQGWRIPDLTSPNIVPNADYGITPWYKKNLLVATPYNIINNYNGVRVSSAASSAALGYVFGDSLYKIGTFPNAGSRGMRNVTSNETAADKYNFINFQYTGWWTADLNESRGRPVNVLFETVGNSMLAYHDNNDPYFANTCRCVKVTYDDKGLEEGPIVRLPVTPNDGGTLSDGEVVAAIGQDKYSLYPNPVESNLYIDAIKGQKYEYKIYNMIGQVVKSGSFVEDYINLTNLSKGVYFIKIENSNKIFKIIKK